VKPVLGEFNSGVSMCPNKGCQSVLGTPILSDRALPPTLPMLLRSDVTRSLSKL